MYPFLRKCKNYKRNGYCMYALDLSSGKSSSSQILTLIPIFPVVIWSIVVVNIAGLYIKLHTVDDAQKHLSVRSWSYQQQPIHPISTFLVRMLVEIQLDYNQQQQHLQFHLCFQNDPIKIWCWMGPSLLQYQYDMFTISKHK